MGVCRLKHRCLYEVDSFIDIPKSTRCKLIYEINLNYQIEIIKQYPNISKQGIRLKIIEQTLFDYFVVNKNDNVFMVEF